jgi:hypothetical protein
MKGPPGRNNTCRLLEHTPQLRLSILDPITMLVSHSHSPALFPLHPSSESEELALA